jgi:hypothetical protein
MTPRMRPIPPFPRRLRSAGRSGPIGFPIAGLPTKPIVRGNRHRFLDEQTENPDLALISRAYGCTT